MFVKGRRPQILSSFLFFATSYDWKRTSAAYVLGAALSISIVVTIAFLLGGGDLDDGLERHLYYIILALLLFGMVHTFLT